LLRGAPAVAVFSFPVVEAVLVALPEFDCDPPTDPPEELFDWEAPAWLLEWFDWLADELEPSPELVAELVFPLLLALELALAEFDWSCAMATAEVPARNAETRDVMINLRVM